MQYDVNITYPLDLTHKRKARTLVAIKAKRVLDAQYQDAVRLQIDNLYTAYTDVLGARETIRFAEAARQGLGVLLDRTRRMYERGTRTMADVSRLEALNEAAEVEAMDAEEEVLRSAKRNLGVLLSMPGPEAEALLIRGSIRDIYRRPAGRRADPHRGGLPARRRGLPARPPARRPRRSGSPWGEPDVRRVRALSALHVPE